ncbi:sufE-like protein 2, chloroplastic isoform X2 [Hevea brasiliensis]|uniref:sufE-like protein 2, chloroplastic isoform X2 n=1 Tax=Hevea brasiliensis TaxID=3981 RepID=UPI0025EC089D|nr:sufE-like protein 2, chloroplastic isoform X2 [Hevea brasiliensis]
MISTTFNIPTSLSFPKLLKNNNPNPRSNGNIIKFSPFNLNSSIFKFPSKRHNLLVSCSAATRAPVGTTTRTEVAGDRIQRLVSEFESLEEPIERVKRLLDYAARLPPFDESARLPGNRVMGCTTQVWLEARMDENGRMRFRADSDSEITKGFISCLIWLLDGAEPAEVVAVKSEDLAAMNVGLYGKAQSRVNTWLNVLINMQNRTKALAAGRKELPLEPLPSLVVNTDGIGGTGTFAQAQARGPNSALHLGAKSFAL